jgi:hypothetical protein
MSRREPIAFRARHNASRVSIATIFPTPDCERSRHSLAQECISSRLGCTATRGSNHRSTDEDLCLQFWRDLDHTPSRRIYASEVLWENSNQPRHDRTRVLRLGKPGLLDMAFMSRCDHHICANSTFSWWGAFLRVSHRELSATPVDLVREDQELRRWGDCCDHLDRPFVIGQGTGTVGLCSERDSRLFEHGPRSYSAAPAGRQTS